MIQAPKKLLFAIKTLDSAAGGAEKVFCQVASNMAERGYSASILTFDPPQAQPFYDIHPAIDKIFLGIGTTARKSTFLETLQRIWAIRSATRTEKPDVVIAFMHSMFVPVSLALIGTGIPVIASEHTVYEHYEDKKLEFMMFKIAALFVKKITVVSEQVHASFPASLRNRMIVIPNPIHISKNVQPEAVQPKIILNVGRLDPKKDQETLIRAFAKIADEYPDWNLRIVGEGERRPQLEELIAGLGLQSRIFLPGAVKDIESVYKNAAFFVTASRYESLGLATLEALAAGLPAIGFKDCPGTNKIIHDGHNGYLVAAADRASGLAKAMKKLLESEDQRRELSQNAVTSVKEHSAHDIYQAWQSLIRNVFVI